MNIIAEIRSFNRFYTSATGLLAPRLPSSALTLSEGRILFELAHRPGIVAAEISRDLGLDGAQVSRTLRRFDERGWLSRSASNDHGKRLALHLTKAGKAEFEVINSGTEADLAARFAHVCAEDRRKLAKAFATIKSALAADAPTPEMKIRGLKVGDLGAVIAQQARGYEQQFGWNQEYEGLIAKILGEFVRDFDRAKDDAWIVDREGDVVGSIFLVRGDTPAIAKLRLLYLEPTARGSGLGQALVQRCIERARELGYREMVLWTNSVLSAARMLYERAGFELIEEESHHSFGQDLVGQTWHLDL